MEFGCCFILFGMVVSRKGDSGKATSHYFYILFVLRAKLVIYAFMGHNLNGIYVLYAWMVLILLMFHIIACYVRSNM